MHGLNPKTYGSKIASLEAFCASTLASTSSLVPALNPESYVGMGALPRIIFGTFMTDDKVYTYFPRVTPWVKRSTVTSMHKGSPYNLLIPESQSLDTT